LVPESGHSLHRGECPIGAISGSANCRKGIRANAAAERFFGYSRDEAVGQKIFVIVPPNKQQEEADILKQHKDGQAVDQFETVRIRKNGRRIDLLLGVSPVRSSRGAIIGATKVAAGAAYRRTH
jgi:PAS domain S-box-containing protein